MKKAILDFLGISVGFAFFWAIIFYCLFSSVSLPQVQYSTSQKSCVQVIANSSASCSKLPEKYNFVYVE